MPFTTASLISRRNFTLAGAHNCLNNNVHWELVYSCIIKITSTKWAQEQMYPVARSAISNFKTNPCLEVKGRL